MIVLRQSAANNNASPGSVGSANLTFQNPVAAGSMVVCALSAYAASTTLGVSDNVNGSSWIDTIAQANANATLGVFYFPNSLAGTMQVNCTQTGSPQPMRFCLQEWTGLLSTNTRDQAAAASTGSTTTPSSGNTGATTQASELVLGAISGASGTPTITAGGAATLDFATAGRLGLEYQIVSSTGVQSAAFGYGTSDFAAVVCATFFAAAAGVQQIGPLYHRRNVLYMDN